MSGTEAGGMQVAREHQGEPKEKLGGVLDAPATSLSSPSFSLSPSPPVGGERKRKRRRSKAGLDVDLDGGYWSSLSYNRGRDSLSFASSSLASPPCSPVALRQQPEQVEEEEPVSSLSPAPAASHSPSSFASPSAVSALAIGLAEREEEARRSSKKPQVVLEAELDGSYWSNITVNRLTSRRSCTPQRRTETEEEKKRLAPPPPTPEPIFTPSSAPVVHLEAREDESAVVCVSSPTQPAKLRTKSARKSLQLEAELDGSYWTNVSYRRRKEAEELAISSPAPRKAAKAVSPDGPKGQVRPLDLTGSRTTPASPAPAVVPLTPNALLLKLVQESAPKLSADLDGDYWAMKTPGAKRERKSKMLNSFAVLFQADHEGVKRRKEKGRQREGADAEKHKRTKSKKELLKRAQYFEKRRQQKQRAAAELQEKIDARMSLLVARELVQYEGVEVWQNLYVSGKYLASDPIGLRERNVVAVVNCTNSQSNNHLLYAKLGISSMTVGMEDDCHEDLIGICLQTRSAEEQDVFSFIAHHMREGTVLIHCKMGQSRSVAVLLLFAMGYLQLSLSAAMRQVEAVHPAPLVNSGFQQKLMDFEKLCTGQSTYVFSNRKKKGQKKEEARSLARPATEWRTQSAPSVTLLPPVKKRALQPSGFFSQPNVSHSVLPSSLLLAAMGKTASQSLAMGENDEEEEEEEEDEAEDWEMAESSSPIEEEDSLMVDVDIASPRHEPRVVQYDWLQNNTATVAAFN